MKLLRLLICLSIVAGNLGILEVYAEGKGRKKQPQKAQDTSITEQTVTINKTDKTFSGVTLLPEEGNASVELVDMTGSPIHTWKVDADRARLLPNCNLLVVHGTKWGTKREPWRSLRRKVREYDWDGNVVWEYSGDDVFHHDIRKISDDEYLVLKRTIVPEEYQLRIVDPVRRLKKIRADSVVLVKKNSEGKSSKVWEWNAHEHLDLNFVGTGGWTRFTSEDGAKFRMQDWTHMNTVALIPENKWFDKGDKRFAPGNLIVHMRNWSTTMIIDRKTGEVIWKYSGDYRGGLSGGHEPHMIKKGLPGAGNILIFDNGKKTHDNESIILEINPVTNEIVWKYEAGKEFFSQAAGSVQRLPNGNTLISEDRRKRVFEVNKDGEILWELKNIHETNRSTRYEENYCPNIKTAIASAKNKNSGSFFAKFMNYFKNG